jgi:hypothetical protein
MFQQSIQFYNFFTQQYDAAFTYMLPTHHSTYNAVPLFFIGNYVSPISREMRVKVSVKQLGPGSVSSWNASWEQGCFIVNM